MQPCPNIIFWGAEEYLVTEMNRAMVITLHFFALQNILREITKTCCISVLRNTGALSKIRWSEQQY
jgi:hypothetical protein